jgi:hypothetical protein
MIDKRTQAIVFGRKAYFGCVLLLILTLILSGLSLSLLIALIGLILFVALLTELSLRVFLSQKGSLSTKVPLKQDATRSELEASLLVDTEFDRAREMFCAYELGSFMT